MFQGRFDVAVGSVVTGLVGGQQFDDGVFAPDKRVRVGDIVRGFLVGDYRVRNHTGVATMTAEAAVKEFVNDQRIAEIRHVVSEVEFVPKGFGKAVRVRVYRHASTAEMPYFYQTSHFAHTPLQTAPYIASDPWESSAAAATTRAIEELLSFLEEAKNKGRAPHDDWLVENAVWA
jgi:hypothetical protein